MVRPSLEWAAFFAHSGGEEIIIMEEGERLMGTDMMLLRQRLQNERQEREQWRMYRWVGICAMLAIACLVILSLIY